MEDFELQRAIEAGLDAVLLDHAQDADAPDAGRIAEGWHPEVEGLLSFAGADLIVLFVGQFLGGQASHKVG